MSKVSKRSTKGKSEAGEVGAATTPPTAATKPGFNTSFYPGRRLTLSTFNGQNYIHIREYLSTDDGKEYPTKKGASFTPGRLAVLRGKLPAIDAALHQQEVNESYSVTVEAGQLYKAHLGMGIYVSVNEKYPGVSIRRYWRPDGLEKPVPTKNGIYLPTSQWKVLLAKLDELLIAHPELLVAQECSLTHDNQMGILDCNECMPFGWMT